MNNQTLNDASTRRIYLLQSIFMTKTDYILVSSLCYKVIFSNKVIQLIYDATKSNTPLW